MNNILQINPDGRSVRLCARKTCCPTMSLVDENTVQITDDNGNTVMMNIEQAKLLGHGVSTLTENKRQLLHE